MSLRRRAAPRSPRAAPGPGSLASTASGVNSVSPGRARSIAPSTGPSLTASRGPNP